MKGAYDLVVDYIIQEKMNKFNNNDFDKFVAFIGTPGIKQMLYNTKINFADMAGSIFKKFNE